MKTRRARDGRRRHANRSSTASICRTSTCRCAVGVRRCRTACRRPRPGEQSERGRVWSGPDRRGRRDTGDPGGETQPGEQGAPPRRRHRCYRAAGSGQAPDSGSGVVHARRERLASGWTRYQGEGLRFGRAETWAGDARTETAAARTTVMQQQHRCEACCRRCGRSRAATRCARGGAAILGSPNVRDGTHGAFLACSRAVAPGRSRPRATFPVLWLVETEDRGGNARGCPANEQTVVSCSTISGKPARGRHPGSPGEASRGSLARRPGHRRYDGDSARRRGEYIGGGTTVRQRMATPSLRSERAGGRHTRRRTGEEGMRWAARIPYERSHSGP